MDVLGWILGTCVLVTLALVFTAGWQAHKWASRRSR